jgi:hypothetical protein
MVNEAKDDRFPGRIVARRRSRLRPAVLLAKRNRRRTVHLRSDARMEFNGYRYERLHSILDHVILSYLHSQLCAAILSKTEVGIVSKRKQPNQPTLRLAARNGTAR